MEVKVGEVSDSEIKVSISGEVDADNCSDMAAKLLQAGPHELGLALDVSALGFIDSSGISELLRVREIKVAAGGSLVLLEPSDSVMRVIQITGLVETFGL